MPTTTEYLTTAEAAKRLKISERRVRVLCGEGRLGRKIGRNYAITAAQVSRFKKKPRPVGNLTGEARHHKGRPAKPVDSK